MEEAVGKLIDEVGGIIGAVAVALALRWGARRWPLPGDDRRRRRRSYDDLAEDEE